VELSSSRSLGSLLQIVRLEVPTVGISFAMGSASVLCTALEVPPKFCSGPGSVLHACGDLTTPDLLPLLTRCVSRGF
jgi:hypothetical protein